MKDLSILKPEQFELLKGTIEAHQYRFDSERNLYIKQIRLIKGVAKLRETAPKYVLAISIGPYEYYLMRLPANLIRRGVTHCLGLIFTRLLSSMEGFDDSEKKAAVWGKFVGAKLFHKKYTPIPTPINNETLRGSLPEVPSEHPA
jgi:hypothetical protein